MEDNIDFRGFLIKIIRYKEKEKKSLIKKIKNINLQLEGLWIIFEMKKNEMEESQWEEIENFLNMVVSQLEKGK
jgi:hypothetical protein